MNMDYREAASEMGALLVYVKGLRRVHESLRKLNGAFTDRGELLEAGEEDDVDYLLDHCDVITH